MEIILNNEYVERIEIVMKEIVDSKGWLEILILNFVVEDIFVDFGVYCINVSSWYLFIENVVLCCFLGRIEFYDKYGVIRDVM